MKEIFKQYATYNGWANRRLGEVIATLSAEQVDKNITSSFPGIQPTLLHLWNAESVWWQRYKLVEHIVWPNATPGYSVKTILQELYQQDNIWIAAINNITEMALAHVFAYQNSKKEQFKQPLYQALLHLFNHSTYHRGQLVTLLRQLEVTKIPSTDFIAWSRENMK